MHEPATLQHGDLADPAERGRAVRLLLDHLSTSTPGWTGPEALVRVEVDLPGGGSDSWTVRFHSSGIALVSAPPQIVLRLPLSAALELVAGTADGALLHLAGILQVSGDEHLLLGVGGALRTATGRPLIDPTALDPVAVSAAIAGASTEHLAAVMAGGFRELVLSEVFRRMPEFLIAHKAARARVAIAFEIGGRRNGAADRYVVRVENGACTVLAVTDDGEHPSGDPGGKVDATLVLEGHQFLRLVLGHLNPVRGVVSGEIKVRGQMIKALGFNSIMRIPGI